MSIEQVVDLSMPENQKPYIKLSLINKILAALSVIFVIQLIFDQNLALNLKISPLIFVVLILVSRFNAVRIKRRDLSSRGLTTYRYDPSDETLTIQDRLIETKLSREVRRSVLLREDGQLIRYLEDGVVFVPNGPVRTALERSHP